MQQVITTYGKRIISNAALAAYIAVPFSSFATCALFSMNYKNNTSLITAGIVGLIPAYIDSFVSFGRLFHKRITYRKIVKVMLKRAAMFAMVAFIAFMARQWRFIECARRDPLKIGFMSISVANLMVAKNNLSQ